MKRLISFMALSAMLCIAAGCAAISPLDGESTVEETFSSIEETTASTEQTEIDESQWEHIVDWYDDEVGIGGSVIPDLHDYCLATVIVKVIRWTDGGCEAEVAVPYVVDFNTDIRQDYYFEQELCGHLQEGDAVTIDFEDESLIVYEHSRYTAWKHGVPADSEVAEGEIMAVSVGTIDADDHITSDYICYGDYYHEDDVLTANENLREWNAEDWTQNPGILIKPLSELPYTVVRLREWTVANRRVFRFTYDVLEKSEGITRTPLSVVDQGNILYRIPERNIVGFNAPSPEDFPAGTVVKLCYVEDSEQPVYMESVDFDG